MSKQLFSLSLNEEQARIFTTEYSLFCPRHVVFGSWVCLMSHHWSGLAHLYYDDYAVLSGGLVALTLS